MPDLSGALRTIDKTSMKALIVNRLAY